MAFDVIFSDHINSQVKNYYKNILLRGCLLPLHKNIKMLIGVLKPQSSRVYKASTDIYLQ